ncbi:hypothetical protein [Actinophytocola sp.]|uniref:hypothetical protein n=1 Tax=Actinophytocola sp. TaxID=1872138 RepID=UPI003D6AF23A
MSEPTPRQRILAECARLGRPEVVARCVRLLEGGDVADAFVRVLAGRTASWWLARREDEELRYWARVWSARGLLWAWEASALPALRMALHDPAWRVREMAAKVVAHNVLGDAFDDVARLRTTRCAGSGPRRPERSRPSRRRAREHRGARRRARAACSRRRQMNVRCDQRSGSGRTSDTAASTEAATARNTQPHT